MASDDVPLPSLIEAVTPWRAALVTVEYDIGYHDGEAPRGIGWGERCPNCGRVHGNPLEQRIMAENPVRAPGFLLRPDRVLTPDLQVHPRFIRGITVHAGNRSFAAEPEAFRLEQPGVLLALNEPVPEIMPISFGALSTGPFLAAYRTHLNGMDQFMVQEIGAGITVPEYGEPFIAIPAAVLITDRSGTPAGIRLTGELPLGDDWQGDPLDDVWIDADAIAGQQAVLADIVNTGLLHVELYFRSPRPTPGQAQMHSRMRSHNPMQPRAVDENATEHHTVGVVIAPDRILALAGLPPGLTARLERIIVNLPDGRRVPAGFSGTIKDYQALLITPETPIGNPLELNFEPVAECRHRLLFGVDIMVAPGLREVQLERLRLATFQEGHRGQIVPAMANASPNMFIFEGTRLLAMPVQQRNRLQAIQPGRHFQSSQVFHHPMAYWQAILNDPAMALDTANAPLDAIDESRVAWIGVELQPMVYDLALLHGVLRQTGNGQSGAIVTHVYEGSPAQAKGIQVGDIILRLTTDDLPAPVNLRLQPTQQGMQFQWEMLDRMPAQHLEQLQPPWPDAHNPFNQLLTGLGEGTGVIIDLVRDGIQRQARFTIETGPPTYASAARLNLETMGLAIRDLSYEVRHFMQRQTDEPGIIVSRVEPGGKAAVSGIRPFELITHVNGEPIHSIKEFEAITAQPGDKQLAVQRMSVGRLVRITE